MTKERRNNIIITTLLSFLPVIVGFILYDRLPDNVPVHYDFSGNADGYYPKLNAVLTGLMLPFIHVICIFVTLSDPKNRNVSRKVNSLVFWIIPVLTIPMCLMMYGSSLGLDINAAFIAKLMVGLLFILIGNYLPKCRQNYTIGIRCSWTLNDSENWDRTHRFSGYLYILCGIAILLSTLSEGAAGMYIFVAVMVMCVSLPMIYSYLFYRKKNQK